MNMDGSIINGQEVQKLIISRSGSLNARVIKSVGNYIVYVMDNAGNRYIGITNKT